MRKLKKLLLIHWYTYEHELIEFEDLNFLTGNTASGKSTVIDALQLVLLGDTNGNFFNKAANEKSVRTLKSYLFGENGDDGQSGFRYLRKGPFTSYVAAEFEDTEKNSSFVMGIVCDCYEDMNFDYKWFVTDRLGIPEDHFIDRKTSTPLSIPALKSYLRKEAGKGFEIIDTNKRYQEIILGKYGALKRKYLTLLKKAVPFTPITDIESFITESVCDVNGNISIEQMQSDIRQYKNLEADAIRTKQRIEALTKVAELTEKYEAQKDRFLQQSYIILRAEKEEKLQEALACEEDLKNRLETIESCRGELDKLSAVMKELSARVEQLEAEYLTSDITKKQKALEEELSGLRKEIALKESMLSDAVEKLREYGKIWEKQLSRVTDFDFAVPDDMGKLPEKLSRIENADLNDTLLTEAVPVMEQLKNLFADRSYELKTRISQIKSRLDELTDRIEKLKKGIKPYPEKVLRLKALLEKKLFESGRRAVEVPVFADLLEIKDPAWQNAIEGYLDRQKFNLLVPEEYYQEANTIYNACRSEENLYDVGLVDIGKLRREFTKKPMAGSLAEEIETDHPDARLYADYLLGNVIKCENASELNRYGIAITKNVMLYKGYVSRRLSPARYEDPFIGRRSLEIQLQRLERESGTLEKSNTELLNEHRIFKQASEQPVMSANEATQYTKAAEEARLIPELSRQLKEKQEEYDGLDLTYITKVKEKLEQAKKEKASAESSYANLDRKTAVLSEQARRIAEEELPRKKTEVGDVDRRIGDEFDQAWITGVGEPRYLKEAQQGGRTKMSMVDSFRRAREQTRTIMENLLKDRRRERSEYNRDYRMGYDIEREDNQEFDAQLHQLSDIKLPQYIEQIRDAKDKAYNQFRDDFIAKLKSNIETVRDQIAELNASLKNSVFGTDRYRFTISPRAEYRSYYDMITDPMLMDTGGWNIASKNFNEKYQKEIDALFKALIITDTDLSAERRAEYERSIKKFTDYKTYLVFDLIVTNDQGEEQRLSRTLLKKSGGETQIPFYIALLASFSQVCRVKTRGRNNTARLIVLDEAFSKMDGERIRESIALLKRFELQAIFSAPPDKIPDISPLVSRSIAVYKSGHDSFTRHFDPAEIEQVCEQMEENE